MPRTRLLLTLLFLYLAAPLAAQPIPNGVQIANAYAIQPDLVYHRASGTELSLDLYRPRDAEGPVPVVIYYHGGGWVSGSRHRSALNVLPYLEQGFAVANVSYRLADTAPAPAAAVDALCAVQWVAANAEQYALDPQRIVVTGHSAGGHLALIAASLSEDSPLARGCATLARPFDGGPPARVAAVINWYGITDVADLLVEPNRQFYAEQWIGAQLAGEVIANEVSPLTHVREGLPPILSIHGDADDLVPYGHALRLHDALEATGNVHELITVEGGGHGRFGPDRTAELYVSIRAFLDSQGLLPD